MSAGSINHHAVPWSTHPNRRRRTKGHPGQGPVNGARDLYSTGLGNDGGGNRGGNNGEEGITGISGISGITGSHGGPGVVDGLPMPQRRPWLVVRQSYALTRKNVLMRLRSPWLLVGQLAAAVALVGLIWVVDAAMRYSNAGFGGQAEVRSPEARRVGPVPLCRDSPILKQGVPCHTLLYTPAGDPWVEALVGGLAAANTPPIPPEQIRAFDTMAQVDAYLWEHPQTVLAALHFRRRPGTPPATATNSSWSGPRALSFVVQTNATATFFKGQFQDPNTYIAIPLQVAVEAQMARMAVGDPTLPWHVSLANFPHPSLTTTSTVGRFAPTFLLAAVVVNFVVLLTFMVSERESGTRAALSAMGLRDTAHWISWVVPEVLLTAAHSALLLGSAVAMRLPLATRNNGGLLFLLLWGSELSMSAIALVLSAVLSRASAAVPAGFAVYIVSWVLQLVVQFGFPFHPGVATGWVGLFGALPPCVLTKGLQDLANAVLGSGPGISWRHRNDYCWAEMPPPAIRSSLPYWQSDCIVPVGQAIWLLPLQAAGFTVIAVYLDAVLPRGEGGGGGAAPWTPLLALLPAALRPWESEAGRRARSARRASTAFARDEEERRQHMARGEVIGGSAGQIPVAASEVSGSDSTAVRNGTLSLGAAGHVDPGVVEETIVVQALGHRYVAEIRSTAPGGLRDSVAAAEAVPNDDVSPVADTGLGRWRGHGHRNGDGDGINNSCEKDLTDWREGVVLLGLRKEYGSRAWLGECLSAFSAVILKVWCCWRRRPSAAEGDGATVVRENRVYGQVEPAQDPSGRGDDDKDRASGSRQRRGPHVAVYGTWLRIVPGECFCLLGPNGAGKTTTIKCLTGAISPTAGDALVYGTSVRDAAGLDTARSMTGICPQFDVLWGALSGREHLALMADVKGLPVSVRQQEVERMLLQVRLNSAADRPAASYSGGMRRRLSVAAALLGDPRVVYLDEPTTGMDPVSRNHVWELISRAKAGRCLVLTTHSMEEAEVLGDRIAVLAAGRLRCLGHSLALKRRYGRGYCLSVGLRELQSQQQRGELCGDGEEGLRGAGQDEVDNRAGGGGSGDYESDAASRIAISGSSGGGGSSTGGSGGHGNGGSSGGGEEEGRQGRSGGSGISNRLTATRTAVGALEELVAESLALAVSRGAGSCRAMTGAGEGNGAGQVEVRVGRSHVHIQVPRACESRLPLLFEALEAKGSALGIVDTHIKLSSLEDVYLEVVRQFK